MEAGPNQDPCDLLHVEARCLTWTMSQLRSHRLASDALRILHRSPCIQDTRIWQSPVFHLKNYHRQPMPVVVGTMFTCMQALRVNFRVHTPDFRAQATQELVTLQLGLFRSSNHLVLELLSPSVSVATLGGTHIEMETPADPRTPPRSWPASRTRMPCASHTPPTRSPWSWQGQATAPLFTRQGSCVWELEQH